MAKFTFDAYKEAFQNIIDVLGLQNDDQEDYVIADDITEKQLIADLNEAIAEINPATDNFTPETDEVIAFLSKGSKKKVVEVEEEVESTPDDVAERIHQKNVGKKSVKTSASDAVDVDEIPSAEDTTPPPKKTRVSKPVTEKYTRVTAIVEILKKNPKLKQKDVVSAADKLYTAKTGGRSNMKQTNRRYLTVIQVYNLLRT